MKCVCTSQRYIEEVVVFATAIFDNAPTEVLLQDDIDSLDGILYNQYLFVFKSLLLLMNIEKLFLQIYLVELVRDDLILKGVAGDVTLVHDDSKCNLIFIRISRCSK
jgi:hypothetical protein